MQPTDSCPICHRRRFLRQALLGSAAFFTVPGAFAEQLVRTPRQTEGPYYPDQLPLDTDNDLILINDGITPAVGEITHLSGQVFDLKGEPLRNAVVEIWQVDNNGVYIHSRDPRKAALDTNFQGYGRFLTDWKGRYYFRTLKPVHYSFRTPHIHVAVSHNSKRVLTTQCYIKGEPDNVDDPILSRVKDPRARESIIIPFEPIARSEAGELSARFDIVVGHTPEDPKEDTVRRRARDGRLRPGGGNRPD